MTQRRPYSIAIIASPIAVLPDEASTTVPPARSRPSAIACSTMWRAMRSFTLPIGFMYSSLA